MPASTGIVICIILVLNPNIWRELLPVELEGGLSRRNCWVARRALHRRSPLRKRVARRGLPSGAPQRGARQGIEAADGGRSWEPVELCAIGIIIRTDQLRKIVEFTGPLGFRYYTATARWQRNLGDDSSLLQKLYLEGKRR